MISATLACDLVSQGRTQEATRSHYDPLQTDSTQNALSVDLDIDNSTEKRDVPIRIYYPSTLGKGTDKAPVVLFSHGLGGSRNGSPHIGQHWAKRGYIAVFLQHPGSDTSVWKDAPMRERMQAMNNAASAENFVKRNQDVKSVLDHLEAWQKSPTSAPKDIASWISRIDLEHIGMSGHSFGAVTTQAVSGQSFPLGRNFTDPRIKAAVVLSPSTPKLGNPDNAFGKVNIPWLLMTGTKDTSPIGNTDVASRLAVYPALPPGNKYEMVLFDAEHSFPTERSLPGERGKRNPNHSKAVLAISTAFWDAHLRQDPKAIAWLDGSGPESILEKADTWKHK